jgi:hypothetical protein
MLESLPLINLGLDVIPKCSIPVLSLQQLRGKKKKHSNIVTDQSSIYGVFIMHVTASSILVATFKIIFPANKNFVAVHK